MGHINDITFKSIDDLFPFIRMKPKDTLTVDSEEMLFKQFRKQYLEDAYKIFLNENARMWDEMEYSRRR